jgi:hypothetical protein
VNTPLYHYDEEAPVTISVPFMELMERIPLEYLQDPRGGSSGRPSRGTVELPCKDLLSGNTPRLSLGTLSDLLPGRIVLSTEADRIRKVELPAGWLVLYYRLSTRRKVKNNEGGDASQSLGSQGAEQPNPDPRRDISHTPGQPLSESDAKATAKPDRNQVPGAGKEQSPPLNLPNHHHEEPDPVGFSEKHGERMILPERAVNRGIFASLPIFSRHRPAETSPDPKDAAVSRENVVLEEKEPLETQPLVHGEEKTPLALTVEPLWKLDPEEQIEDPSALQELFMTEEKLTLDRVIGLAGQLPGIRACVLAYGDQVVCASHPTTGLDLQTLSGQAMTMLSQIREASDKMGLGAVPAVTLHAEQGALSFIHKGELCLLVMHADRGFVPGVRERLQEILGHLSYAKALPTKGVC